MLIFHSLKISEELEYETGEFNIIKETNLDESLIRQPYLFCLHVAYLRFPDTTMVRLNGPHLAVPRVNGQCPAYHSPGSQDTNDVGCVVIRGPHEKKVM